MDSLVEEAETFGNNALSPLVGDSESSAGNIRPFGTRHLRSRAHACRSQERLGLDEIKEKSRQDVFNGYKHPSFRGCRTVVFSKGKLPQVRAKFPEYDVVRTAKILKTSLPIERYASDNAPRLWFYVFKFDTLKCALGYRCNLIVSPLCNLAKWSIVPLIILLENLSKQPSFMLLEEFGKFAFGGDMGA